jgi:hypothetical protein
MDDGSHETEMNVVLRWQPNREKRRSSLDGET